MIRLVRPFPIKRHALPFTQRTIFIKTETTPNPLSMKFLPGREVLPAEFGTGMQIDRSNVQVAKRSMLAKAIFKLNNINSIFLGRDFITVTKEKGDSWKDLKPMIFSTILDFFEQEVPVIDEPLSADGVTDTTILDTDDEVIASIKELMETRVRPSVQEDGGDIFYVGFDVLTGIVKVKLAGSCVGCPSSSVTLRNGVEKMLMHYIPEVKGVLPALIYCCCIFADVLLLGIEEVTDEVSDEQKLEFHPDPVPTLDNMAASATAASSQTQ